MSQLGLSPSGQFCCAMMMSVRQEGRGREARGWWEGISGDSSARMCLRGAVKEQLRHASLIGAVEFKFRNAGHEHILMPNRGFLDSPQKDLQRAAATMYCQGRHEYWGPYRTAINTGRRPCDRSDIATLAKAKLGQFAPTCGFYQAKSLAACMTPRALRPILEGIIASKLGLAG